MKASKVLNSNRQGKVIKKKKSHRHRINIKSFLKGDIMGKGFKSETFDCFQIFNLCLIIKHYVLWLKDLYCNWHVLILIMIFFFL